MLLIIDEAQTGIGRAGDLFAFMHADNDVVPDVLTLSKTLGNSLPLSAVVASDAIATVCRDRGYLFYTMHVNDPLPAAVGLKVLDVAVRDGLVERSRRLGVRLQAALRELQTRYACIGDVRVRGLTAGLEIVADRETKAEATEFRYMIAARMTKLGLWAQLSTNLSFAGCFRIAPPITTTEEQLEERRRFGVWRARWYGVDEKAETNSHEQSRL
jgi:4-aminobutyrate aminotransferase-like enzyme